MDNDLYECPDPIRSYKAKVRIVNDEERPNEHLTPSTRTNERLQSEVPSFARSLGTGAVKWFGITKILNGEVYICTAE